MSWTVYHIISNMSIHSSCKSPFINRKKRNLLKEQEVIVEKTDCILNSYSWKHNYVQRSSLTEAHPQIFFNLDLEFISFASFSVPQTIFPNWHSCYNYFNHIKRPQRHRNLNWILKNSATVNSKRPYLRKGVNSSSVFIISAGKLLKI